MAKRSSGFVLALMGLLAATGARSEPTSPAARAVRVDPSWVVGEAAAAVDPASGLFVLLPAATSVISVAAAEAAAVAYARYVLNPATTLELSARLATDRGRAISTWNRLSACARTVRAESPFGIVSGTAVADVLRYLAANWAVALCGPSGTPELSVGVADARSGARFDGPDYRLTDIDSLKNMHSIIGIPVARRDEVAPSPEASVGALFALTGRPVSKVPRALMYWAPRMRVSALPFWELELSSPAAARFDTGESAGAVTTVFARLDVGDVLRFYVPDAVQPAALWVPYLVSASPIVVDSTEIPVIRPINFRRVTFP